MEARKDTALRKRQLILDSSKKMFLWVASASVIVGFAAVISWFLFQQIAFKEHVVSEKNKTIDILKKNNEAAPKLTDNVRVLDTNENLQNAKAKPDEKTLQVILDALPADDNKYALGASMQNVLIGGAQNIKLESFSVDPSTSIAASGGAGGAQQIAFSAVVSSNDPNAIKDLLKRFESSIRTIDIDNLQIEKSDQRMTATVQGHAYYMPEKVIKLGQKAA